MTCPGLDDVLGVLVGYGQQCRLFQQAHELGLVKERALGRGQPIGIECGQRVVPDVAEINLNLRHSRYISTPVVMVSSRGIPWGRQSIVCSFSTCLSTVCAYVVDAELGREAHERLPSQTSVRASFVVVFLLTKPVVYRRVA